MSLSTSLEVPWVGGRKAPDSHVIPILTYSFTSDKFLLPCSSVSPGRKEATRRTDSLLTLAFFFL